MVQRKQRPSRKDVIGLHKAWEGIIAEYEELTRENAYSNHMAISNDRQRKINRVIGIKAALMLFTINEQKGREALIFWNIKAGELTDEEVTRIRNIILLEQTRININIELDKKNDEKTNFFEHWSDLQAVLGYQLSHEKVSVTEWVGILNTIKKRKRGRGN